MAHTLESAPPDTLQRVYKAARGIEDTAAASEEWYDPLHLVLWGELGSRITMRGIGRATMKLITGPEVFRITRQTHQRHLSIRHELVPESFKEPATVTPTGLRVYGEGKGKDKSYSLALRLEQDPRFAAERQGLTAGIDETADIDHPWSRNFNFTIKIAELSCFISEQQLAELPVALPESIPLRPGRLGQR